MELEAGVPPQEATMAKQEIELPEELKGDPVEKARRLLQEDQETRARTVAAAIEKLLKENNLQLIAQPQTSITQDGLLKLTATVHLIPIPK